MWKNLNIIGFSSSWGQKLDYAKSAYESLRAFASYVLRYVDDAFVIALSNQDIANLVEFQIGSRRLETVAQLSYQANGNKHYAPGALPQRQDINWGGFHPMIDSKKPKSHNHYSGYRTEIAREIYEARARQRKARAPVSIKKVNNVRGGEITLTKRLNFKRHSSLIH